MVVVIGETVCIGHLLPRPVLAKAPTHSPAALRSRRCIKCQRWSAVGLVTPVICKLGQRLTSARAVVRRAAAAGRAQGPRRDRGPKGEAAVHRRGAEPKARPKSLTLYKELQRLGVAGGTHLAALIQQGRVQVAGRTVQDPEMLAPGGAALLLDGIPLDRDPPLILKFHKPFDVISSMSDHKGRQDLSAFPGRRPPWHPDVAEEHQRRTEQLKLEDVLPPGLTSWICVEKYHPVGRLDKDTTGLLLFSRDGKLTRQLLNPLSGVPRCYTAVVQGDAFKLDSEGRSLEERLAAGVVTSEGTCPGRLLSSEALPPAELDRRSANRVRHSWTRDRKAREADAAEAEDMEKYELDPKAGRSKVGLEVREGKYRMVRKMLWRCGLPVLELHRTQYGQVALGDLPVGGLARATAAEEEWAETVF